MFFYLGSVVPAIWFLELDEMETRIHKQEHTETNVTQIIEAHLNITEEELSLNVEGIWVGPFCYPLTDMQEGIYRWPICER